MLWRTHFPNRKGTSVSRACRHGRDIRWERAEIPQRYECRLTPARKPCSTMKLFACARWFRIFVHVTVVLRMRSASLPTFRIQWQCRTGSHKFCAAI